VTPKKERWFGGCQPCVPTLPTSLVEVGILFSASECDKTNLANLANLFLEMIFLITWWSSHRHRYSPLGAEAHPLQRWEEAREL
jgi:hypothetical protein